jgi:hypothetical protein
VAERRLGAPKLSGKQTPFAPAAKPTGKLSGRLTPYVPRGAQYDYKPPSVFARYKALTAVFVILLLSLFGYWAIVLRQPRAAIPPPRRTQPAPAQPAQQPQPQSDPVYIEPLTPPK